MYSFHEAEMAGPHSNGDETDLVIIEFRDLADIP
jgi:uncharacterized protein YciI